MNCTGNSRSFLLPPILYKPTAFRLLQPQLKQSSVVFGTTGRLLCQHIVFAGCRPPLLPQAMRLPQHCYIAPWREEALGSIQGCMFRDIIKRISPPCALSHVALLPRCYYATPWCGLFFRNTLLHNIQPAALTGASLLHRRFYTATRLSENLDSIRKQFFRGMTPGIFLPRRYFSAPWKHEILRPIRQLFFDRINRIVCQPWLHCLAPSRSVIHFARRYFGCFWKVTLAAAFINIMMSFVYHTYLVHIPYTSRTRFFHFETVPYTNRTHFVVRSPLDDRDYGESCFAFIKNRHCSKLLSPLHPDSVRVNLITKELVRAVQHGLAIKSCDVALDHGYPCKEASLDVEHATERKKHKKSCKSQPQTMHLDGLDWEVIVVKNDALVGALSLSNGKIIVFTGLLKHLETDAEIATILAHEVAHVVARHWSERIIYMKWFPYPLKVHLLRRMEIEADHIGMLLLAAAGFDPHIAPVAIEKLLGHDIYHPSGKKRAQLLSRAKIMDEALELYREGTAAKAPEVNISV
ncbi:hypothetical protein ACQ4PT_033233 [Festuca glaucescens]